MSEDTDTYADAELLGETDDDIVTSRRRPSKRKSKTSAAPQASPASAAETPGVATSGDAASDEAAPQAGAPAGPDFVDADTEAEPQAPGGADAVQYADAELLGETNDDILTARRLKGAAKGAARASARVGWIAIVLAVFAGVAFGSWLASRSAPTASPTTTTPAATAAPTTPEPTVDPQVRRTELEAQIAADPNDANARLELGVLLYEQFDDIDGAGQQWLTVSQIDPTNIGAWYNLGFYYLSTDPISCSKAVESWNKVIELQPLSDEANQIQNHMAAIIPERCPAYADQLGSPSPTSGG